MMGMELTDMRRARQGKSSPRPAFVREVGVPEMKEIAEELHAASLVADPIQRAAVLARATDYAGTYYRTPSGSLRRMFPKVGKKLLKKQQRQRG